MAIKVEALDNQSRRYDRHAITPSPGIFTKLTLPNMLSFRVDTQEVTTMRTKLTARKSDGNKLRRSAGYALCHTLGAVPKPKRFLRRY